MGSFKLLIVKCTENISALALLCVHIRAIGFIKEPLEIDYENEAVTDIVTKIEYAIEQHPSFLKVLSPNEADEYIREEEELNKKRTFWNS